MKSWAVKTIGAFLLLIISATDSWALVNGRLHVGLRNGESKLFGDDGEKISGTEVSLGVYVDPLPIPVAVGVLYRTIAWNVSEEDHGLESLNGAEIVPEVMAWLPIGDVKPYAKLGYIFGSHKGEVVGVDVELESSGVNMAVGVYWHLVPFVALLGEVNVATENAKAVEPSEGHSKAFNTTGYLIGVEVGI